jgi:hypothetical protein
MKEPMLDKCCCYFNLKVGCCIYVGLSLIISILEIFQALGDQLKGDGYYGNRHRSSFEEYYKRSPECEYESI